jgi:catechol 2,3-dioxygenase-like lactoylglutathione lyase family enzyme
MKRHPIRHGLCRRCVWLAAFALSLPLTPSAPAQDAPQRPHITGLSHVALYVHDVEKSREFYKSFLGYAEPYSITDSNGALHLTFIKINDRQFIELFPEKQPGSDRLYHIALEVDDAEAMRAYLATRGIKVPAKVPKGHIGNLNFNIFDPDGHQVEIVQYEPDGWTAQHYGKDLPDTRIAPRMSHAGIIVTNSEASMKFYCGILGFQETWRGSRDGKRLSWINLRVPDGRDYLELMLYAALPKPELRRTAHHFCLEVPDVTKASEALATRTLPAGWPPPTQIRTGVNRKRQMNYYDPDGTRVEIMDAATVDGKPTPPSTAPPPEAANASAP